MRPAGGRHRDARRHPVRVELVERKGVRLFHQRRAGCIGCDNDGTATERRGRERNRGRRNRRHAWLRPRVAAARRARASRRGRDDVGRSIHSPGLRCWRLGRANAGIRFRLPRDQPAAGLRQLGPVRHFTPLSSMSITGSRSGGPSAVTARCRRWCVTCTALCSSTLAMPGTPPSTRTTSADPSASSCRRHGPCSCLPAESHRRRGVAARSFRQGWRMGGVCACRTRVLIRRALPVPAGRWLRIVAA